MVFDVNMAIFWEFRSKCCTFYISEVPSYTEFCSDILFGIVCWSYPLILLIDVTTERVSIIFLKQGSRLLSFLWGQMPVIFLFVDRHLASLSEALLFQMAASRINWTKKFGQGFWRRHCWSEQRSAIEHGWRLLRDHCMCMNIKVPVNTDSSTFMPLAEPQLGIY